MNLFIFFFLHFIKNKLHEINFEYRLYPRWIKQKNGNKIECISDKDCPFPSSCCNEPFFPVQFCCNGWNYRKLEYAYMYNTITTKK